MITLTDNQIVAFVKTWNSPPPGYRNNHRLYYYNRVKGWCYLTAAGRQVEPDPEMLALQQERLGAWSKNAVEQLLGRMEE